MIEIPQINNNGAGRPDVDTEPSTPVASSRENEEDPQVEAIIERLATGKEHDTYTQELITVYKKKKLELLYVNNREKLPDSEIKKKYEKIIQKLYDKAKERRNKK